MFQQIDSFVQAVQVIALGLIFFCCMGVNIGAVLVVLRATKRRLKLPRHRRTLGIKDLQDSQSTGWLEDLPLQQGCCLGDPGNRVESSDARGKEEGGCAP